VEGEYKRVERVVKVYNWTGRGILDSGKGKMHFCYIVRKHQTINPK